MESSEWITMGDDGFGELIQIPSIFINENNADLLKEGLDDESLGHKLTLKIVFDTSKTENV